MSQGKLFILSAPSGTGKTTLLSKVMSEIEGLAFSISHTTRNPRKGEIDGVEYHFVDRRSFVEKKDSGYFLEWAEVHGNFYGTSRIGVEDQLAQGLDVLLDIDVQGAGIIRRSGAARATYIFLAPPSVAELERRLRGRGLDSEEIIATRLANARKEMSAMESFEYIIVNDKLDDAVRMFASVILAERAKNRRDVNGKSYTIEMKQ